MYCVKCGLKVPDGSHFCSSCGTKVDVQQSKKSVVTKDQYSYKSSFNIWLGIFTICYIIANALWGMNPTVAGVFYGISVVPAVVTCYYWAKYKGRNPAFAAWGILAPIGFLGVALLKDKWRDEVEQPQVSQETTGVAVNLPDRNTSVSVKVEPAISTRSASPQEADWQSIGTCSKCGSQISINDVFCTKCGAKQILSEKSSDYVEQLQTLAQLRDDGVLTQQEFEEKKAKILRNYM